MNAALKAPMPWIRAVGYHVTPPGAADAFRRQLEWFARRFRNVGEADLAAFFRSRAVAKEALKPGGMPGLIISFDDGLRQHYEIAAPLLEEFGFRGWFFVPSRLPGLDPDAQAEYCAAHGLFVPGGGKDRIAMTGDELRDLAARGHVIGNHTATHHRFRGHPDRFLLAREIGESQVTLKGMLGSAPRSFAWVGGEPDTYAPEAQARVNKVFDYAFTTLSERIMRDSDRHVLHRTVLDADMPFALFRLKMAGLSDIAHRAHRRAMQTSAGAGGRR